LGPAKIIGGTLKKLNPGAGKGGPGRRWWGGFGLPVPPSKEALKKKPRVHSEPGQMSFLERKGKKN